MPITWKRMAMSKSSETCASLQYLVRPSLSSTNAHLSSEANFQLNPVLICREGRCCNSVSQRVHLVVKLPEKCIICA